MVESYFTYTINERGARRIERDTHVTGLFPIATWMDLLEAAGFRTDRISLPGDGDGCGEHLFCGVLVTGREKGRRRRHSRQKAGIQL